jgi:hypothetical protein
MYLAALLGLLSGAPNDIRAEPVEELSTTSSNYAQLGTLEHQLKKQNSWR